MSIKNVDREDLKKATIKGDVVEVKRILLENVKPDLEIMSDAVEGGNINIVKLFLKYDDILNKSSASMKTKEYYVAMAASAGHTVIIDLLLLHKYPIDESAVEFASANNQISTVKYLIFLEAPIDSSGIRQAAGRGYKEIVELLLQVNAPFDDEAIKNAEKEGYDDIVLMLEKSSERSDKMNKYTKPKFTLTYDSKKHVVHTGPTFTLSYVPIKRTFL